MGGNGSLPSLSELLTKSVAELSEEVITLKLEVETEKRSFELKITWKRFYFFIGPAQY